MKKTFKVLLLFIVINLISVLLFVFADILKIQVKILFVVFIFFVSCMPGAYQYFYEYKREEYENMNNRYIGRAGFTIILLISPVLFCKYIYYSLKRNKVYN